MSTRVLLEYALFGETICALAVVCVLVSKHLVGSFSFLLAFASVLVVDTGIRIVTLFFRARVGMSLQSAYNLYFYSYWICAIAEQALLLFVIYHVFRRAMRPFKGLNRFGTLVFKWVLGVAGVVSLGMMMVGNLNTQRIVTVTSQFEQGISILTVCLMLFVCFAIRHLGINYRSHIFGVSLGLGILGTVSLIQSAWFSTHPLPSVYSPVYLIAAIGAILTLSVWGTYFALPEPKRQMVLLPTTSPYFHWNQISEALGDNPGQVAVSGFTPSDLSDAERLVLGASMSTPGISQRKTRTTVRVTAAEPVVATGTQR